MNLILPIDYYTLTTKLKKIVNCHKHFYVVARMHHGLIRYFYPQLSKEEAHKYWILSAIFFVIVGAYWVLRLLKNTIFLKVAFPVCFGWDLEQGCLYQPLAKTWSPLVILLMLLVYSKLVDVVRKHQLFYIFSAFYASLFAFFALLLGLKEWYGPAFLGKNLLAGLGWMSYLFIESYGSLFVALFWSYCNSITDMQSAEVGFPLIVAMAQLSAMLGSLLSFFTGSIGSLWPLMVVATLLVLSIIPLMRYFMTQMAADPLVSRVSLVDPGEREGLWGAFEGLFMLGTRPYLFGLLLISIIYEATSVIVDYQMNRYASMSASFSSELAFAQFQSLYGMGVNLASFIIALFMTSRILSRFGSQIGLLLYPICFALSFGVILMSYASGASSEVILWTMFSIMVLNKALGYALNNPTTEMMFIPTSKQVNFKAKGWIDTFGSRFAKAGGAGVTRLFQHSMLGLMLYGSLAGLGLITIWIVAALYVGRANMRLRAEGAIVD